MKKTILIILLMVGFGAVQGQDFGLSFSYFVPRNGYFSTPISPFSIRGVGFNLNRFIALETGASLYRMTGLNVKGTPLNTKDPMVGPNFTIFVPVELVLELGTQNVEFNIKGGGFLFYGFAQKLNYGNIDRAIRKMESWDVANADLRFRNSPGYGYHAGVELVISVMKQYAVSLECNYLVGSSALPLSGSYTGGTLASVNETKGVDFKDASVDFTGLEFSIGVMMRSSKGRRR